MFVAAVSSRTTAPHASGDLFINPAYQRIGLPPAVERVLDVHTPRGYHREYEAYHAKTDPSPAEHY